MVDEKQIAQMVLEQGKTLAGIEEKLASAHKRINDMSNLVQNIHRLTVSVESLTDEVKQQGEALRNGLKEQGRRIGAVESSVISLSNAAAGIDGINARVKAIELQPGHKWEKAIWLVVTGVITFVLGYFLRVGFGGG